jgi:hypothetical protein
MTRMSECLNELKIKNQFLFFYFLNIINRYDGSPTGDPRHDPLRANKWIVTGRLVYDLNPFKVNLNSLILYPVVRSCQNYQFYVKLVLNVHCDERGSQFFHFNYVVTFIFTF